MAEVLERLHLSPIGEGIWIFALVAALGIALGEIKVFGIKLGIAAVLFAGIAIGHLGLHVDPTILGFAREFGLVLFVFAVGMQTGPSFFASIRSQGLRLNALAAATVGMGALLTVVIAKVSGLDMAAAAGVFCGATTNTPSLGAAVEALSSLSGIDPARLDLPSLGYAAAYPFGVIGIILAMLIVRTLFKVDVAAESAVQQQQEAPPPVSRRNIEIANENLDGLKIKDLPGLSAIEVIISRILRTNQTHTMHPNSQTVLHLGDILLAVGQESQLDELQLIVGRESDQNLMQLPSPVEYHRAMVTNTDVLGKTLSELALGSRFEVSATRVLRAGIEMPVGHGLKLQFGDVIRLVGEKAAIAAASRALGNSLNKLKQTHYLAIFIGLVIGIAVGAIPIALPGMPAPVKLGLAGGPLLVAILMGQLGHLGPIVVHMPANANHAVRELGIVLFLAAVGLKAGDHFVETITSGTGLQWVAMGVAITLLPLLAAATFARLVWRLNYTAICGLLSGSMTDPPALAFANTICGSDAPAVSYATVYPLTMILRILAAQILILFFC